MSRQHRIRTIRWHRTLAGCAAFVLVLGVSACGSDEPDEPTTPTAAPTTSATQTPTAAPTTTPDDGVEPTPTTTDEPDGGEVSGIPVYYIGDSGGSFRLYREWRTVPDEGDPVASALAAMMAVPPLDPDYMSPWVAPDEMEVEREGSNITVDLSADAFSGNAGSELSATAIQQLVYTATAASTLDGPAATTVTILVDGRAADAWGHVRVGEPTERAPQGEVLSHVWILSPQEGDVVDAGDVRISGYGASFEAHFNWTIEGPAGTIEGFTLSDNGAGFAEFRFAEELEPGEYTVTVESSSGLEEFIPFVDSKTFTVR